MSEASNQAAYSNTNGQSAKGIQASTNPGNNMNRPSLTQANIAAHAANTINNVDRQGNVHRWLAHQSEMMSRRDGPTPAVWQRLVQRDPLAADIDAADIDAADIDAAVKEAIKSSKTRK
ncbi:hypothetical protein LTR27_010278 [Elasticomyces elasticus]|nr:hypothetical protein LTR27_010278 [Elasticomyces elasticus]